LTSGCLALALAALNDDVSVTAVDSHSRAVQCTRLGAELNGLADRVNCLLDASGQKVGSGAFDLVVTNPPYYSHYQIAEQFVTTAADALRQGGQLVLVTKQPNWFLENLPVVFGNIEDHSVGHYHVITARRY
jgi:16S rRNA (guanine1207-N2)-methyltransferase